MGGRDCKVLKKASIQLADFKFTWLAFIHIFLL